jgi:hypothetical protein
MRLCPALVPALMLDPSLRGVDGPALNLTSNRFGVTHSGEVVDTFTL